MTVPRSRARFTTSATRDLFASLNRQTRAIFRESPVSPEMRLLDASRSYRKRAKLDRFATAVVRRDGTEVTVCRVQHLRREILLRRCRSHRLSALYSIYLGSASALRLPLRGAFLPRSQWSLKARIEHS